VKSILAGIDSKDMANGLPMTIILPVVVGIDREWFWLEVVRTRMGGDGFDEDGCDGWMRGCEERDLSPGGEVVVLLAL